MRTKRTITTSAAILIAISCLFVFFGNDICICFENDRPSTSVGTPENGSLINGKRLPTRGDNFVTYSYIGSMLGRNTVNGRVRDAVVQTYASINERHPDKRFVYGETGWPGGGRFRPHKSHKNGLSVDFMVPILDEKGRSVPLPASVFNKFGYGIEFDKTGVYDRYKIDYDAMAGHLYELDIYAERNGLSIRKVIFAPELQPFLFETEHGKLIRKRLRFSNSASWVRHDEHYHVDFSVVR